MPTQDIANVSAETPTFGLFKNNFVIGNDVQWVRTVTGLLVSPSPVDTPINAWLTIKSSPAATDASGVQVMITLLTSLTGPGQIINVNQCYFNMTGQATLVLNAGPLYYYDIKVQATPSTRVYTVEQGFIQFLPEVGDKPVPLSASISLPPVIPIVLFGANPPPAGVFAVGTRYWVVPPNEGFPAEWVFTASLAWKVTSVVSQ